MLGYYKNGLNLFIENPPMIIMGILLGVLNLLIIHGLITINFGMNLNLVLGIATFVILLLANSFVYAAVIGIIPKVLSKETITYKTVWEIGKKYIVKVMVLYLLIIVIERILVMAFYTIIFAIIGLLQLNITPYIMEHMIGLFIGASILVGFFSMFVYQSRTIGQNTLISSIKENVNLVFNNKIKTLILLISIMPIYLIKFIPTIGAILEDTISPLLKVYIVIVITLVYVDLMRVK
jgi:hypothetical protein